MKFRISIIILNWNGWKDTIECLESVYQIDYPNYDVIVVDNGSKDDSIQKIKEYCEGKIEVKSKFLNYIPNNKSVEIIEFTKEESEFEDINKKFISLPSNKRIILIENPKNYGFAEGNNVGIRFALDKLNSDFFLVLNNDTVLIKDSIKILIDTYNELHNTCILSPFIHFYYNSKEIQHGGEKVRNIRLKSEKLWKKYPNRNIIKSDTLAGPCFLIPKEIITKIGLLPRECNFLLTDAYYSFKAKEYGYNIYLVRSSKIYHKGSVSLKKVKIITLKSQIKENIIFRHKFMSKNQFILRMIINFLVWYPYLSLKYTVLNKDFKGIKAIFEGLKEGMTHISQN